MDEALLKIVIIAAVETVGLIEVLKKFVTFKKGWKYTLIMIPLAFACSFVYLYLPIAVTAGILAVCISQMFYKNVLQVLEGLVKKLEKD